MIAISTDSDSSVRHDEEVGETGSVPNQLLFREANEQLFHAHPRLGEGSETLSLLCECQRRSCVENLRLTRTAYDAVRRFPTRFLLDPEHVLTLDERVVEAASGYVVVEKVGTSAQLAIRLDPRKRRPLGRVQD